MFTRNIQLIGGVIWNWSTGGRWALPPSKTICYPTTIPTRSQSLTKRVGWSYSRWGSCWLCTTNHRGWLLSWVVNCCSWCRERRGASVRTRCLGVRSNLIIWEGCCRGASCGSIVRPRSIGIWNRGCCRVK
mgnify:CR=1 FL=1